MKAPADLLAVEKEELLDYHKGTIHDVTEKQIEFEMEGEVAAVNRLKVFGLIYRAAGRERSEPVAWIADAGGSRWAVRSMTLARQFEWTTIAGAIGRLPIGQVARIDLSRGKVVYLSDLQPESVAYTPYFSLDKETALATGVLPASRRIGPWSRSRCGWAASSFPRAWPCTAAPRPFTICPVGSTVFAPSRASTTSSVRGATSAWSFAARGRLLWEATLSGAEPPRAIDVDVTGVRRLTVLADFTGDLDVAGHAILGDARVSK